MLVVVVVPSDDDVASAIKAVSVDVPYTPATTPMAATLIYSRTAKTGSRHRLGYTHKVRVGNGNIYRSRETRRLSKKNNGGEKKNMTCPMPPCPLSRM